MKKFKEAFAGRNPDGYEPGQLLFSDLGECAACRETVQEVEALRARVLALEGELFELRKQEAKKAGRKKDDARRVLLRWREYHRENPKVFNAIQRIVCEQRDAGHAHTTIRAIWEGLRTHTWLPGVKSDKPFRLPDHYLPLYVRLVCQYRPEFASMFDTKETCRFEGLDLVAFLRGDDTVLAYVGASERRTYAEINSSRLGREFEEMR